MSVYGRFAFVFIFFVPASSAKAEISWLGTIRGDSQCKAELFLFVSDISALGCTSVCVRVCVFALPAETFCQPFVLILVHQQTQTSACYKRPDSLPSVPIPRFTRAG